MIRFLYFISRERYVPHSISLQTHQSLNNSLFLGARIEHYRSNPFPRKTKDRKLRSIINSNYSFKKINHPISYIFIAHIPTFSNYRKNNADIMKITKFIRLITPIIHERMDLNRVT